MADILSQLLEFRWRGIGVPVIETSTSVGQDQVQHKWANRDGAHVEATGRQPMVIRATIPFRNNIQRGRNETWGTLYPNVFRQFFVAMSTRTSDTLQHPEFGAITCKPTSFDYHYVGMKRDGVDATCSWIESLDDTVTEFEDILARPSPAADAYGVGSELDTQLTQYSNPNFSSPVPTGYSFFSAVQVALSASDAATFANQRIGGSINQIFYLVSALQTSIELLNDATAWPIILSCERMKSSLNGLQTQMLLHERTVGQYVVPFDTTLAAVGVTTHTKVADLLKLNPFLATGPVVPANTVVRFYLPAA